LCLINGPTWRDPLKMLNDGEEADDENNDDAVALLFCAGGGGGGGGGRANVLCCISGPDVLRRGLWYTLNWEELPMRSV
jgi:hypothetical protein